jgi:hypothetical protein
VSRQGPAAKSKLSSQSGASPINGQNSAFSIEKYRLAAGAGLETPTEMTALYCWEHMIAIGNIGIAPEQLSIEHWPAPSERGPFSLLRPCLSQWLSRAAVKSGTGSNLQPIIEIEGVGHCAVVGGAYLCVNSHHGIAMLHRICIFVAGAMVALSIFFVFRPHHPLGGIQPPQETLATTGCVDHPETSAIPAEYGCDKP